MWNMPLKSRIETQIYQWLNAVLGIRPDSSIIEKKKIIITIVSAVDFFLRNRDWKRGRLCLKIIILWMFDSLFLNVTKNIIFAIGKLGYYHTTHCYWNRSLFPIHTIRLATSLSFRRKHENGLIFFIDFFFIRKQFCFSFI